MFEIFALKDALICFSVICLRFSYNVISFCITVYLFIDNACMARYSQINEL